MTGMLILARHGQSEGNLRNVFTGRDDLPLTDEGRDEARFVADQIRKARIKPDVIFTSAMKRTRETAAIISGEFTGSIPIVSDPALNERDYGKLTGLNRDGAARRFGAERVLGWRRSYRQRPPDGESLFDTRRRVVAYFDQAIAPCLEAGANAVVIGHGNCLRALAMELEDLSAFEIQTLEIANGQIFVYKMDTDDREKPRVTLMGRSHPKSRSLA